MTEIDHTLRAAISEAVANAVVGPFARVERRHRVRRARRAATVACGAVVAIGATALAVPRLGDVSVAPAGGGHLKPFAAFRTDERARAGFARCTAAADRNPSSLAHRTPPAGISQEREDDHYSHSLSRDDIERCFRNEGYAAPPREFGERGFTQTDHDTQWVGRTWPRPCQPYPTDRTGDVTVVAEGTTGGVPWAIVSYAGAGGTICVTWNTRPYRPEGGYSMHTPPAHDDTGKPGALQSWLATAGYFADGSTRAGDPEVVVFWGAVASDVARVRLVVQGQPHDVTTVALPVATDRRFVGTAVMCTGDCGANLSWSAVMYNAAGREVSRTASEPFPE